MSSNHNNANDNPGNFANRPTEEVKAIASMGGKASHADESNTEENTHPAGRNNDGTFTKGSEAAKEAGYLGGLHANGKVDEKIEGGADHASGRNTDGTFTKGSEVAKEAGHLGGLHAAGKVDEQIEGGADHAPGRDSDGKFVPGSTAAKEAGSRATHQDDRSATI